MAGRLLLSPGASVAVVVGELGGAPSRLVLAWIFQVKEIDGESLCDGAWKNPGI